MADFDEIVDLIGNYGFVSFDIFDTLLVRPYVRPTDLFRHMEIMEGAEGFASERIAAERRSRKKICNEVTLDEIYDEISPVFKDLKGRELEYEGRLLSADPLGKELFERALDNGSKVLLISDMYLSSEFIRKVLDSKGLCGYDGVFISGEHRSNKRSGDLFDRVLSHLGIPATDMLHIGDNRHSDCAVPLKKGIRAMRFVPLMERYFGEHSRERRFYKRKKCLERSILVGADALAWSLREKEDWWHDFSYRFGGPIAFMFSRFVQKNAQGGNVLFVARDGYIPKRVFEIISGYRAGYVFASRLLSVAFTEDVTEKNAETFLDYYSGLPTVAETLVRCDDAFSTYVRNKELLDGLRDNEKNRYREYLRSTVEKGKVYVADMTTMRYSSQRLVDDVLGPEYDVVGLYYTAMSDSDLEHVSFNDHAKRFNNWSVTNMTEFLMSSGEFPLVGFADGVPIYSNENPECEVYRQIISETIAKGSEDYSVDIMRLFGDLIPDISHRTLSDWLLTGLRPRSEEGMEELRGIYWASDASHKTYRRAIFSMKDIPYYLKNKLGELLYLLKKE